MSLEIESSIADLLPNMVKTSLAKLSVEHQSQFVEEFKRKRKSYGVMQVLAIVFPIQLFLLGKVGLGIVFIITGGGALIWWVIEIIMTHKRVNDYNNDIATQIMRDMKIMNQ